MSEVIVSTSRLKRIRAIDTVNDTITVEAGVVLKEIQSAADRADRLFPLSLGAEGSCQIGGNISTNAGGVQVLRYGNMRNLVLGLEVVLPDGSIWNGLRGLRKDNTGYDMKQLFIGAEGTLGIVTAAVLRLFPKPTASETAWIARGVAGCRRGAAGPRARPPGRRGLGLRADPPLARRLSAGRRARARGPDARRASLVRADGRDEPGSAGLPARARWPRRSLPRRRRALVRDALIAASGAQAAKLWKMRESLPEAVDLGRGRDPARHLGAGLAHPGVHRARRCRCRRRLSGHPPLRLRPRRRRQHALQPRAAPGLGHAARYRAERERINRIVHDIVVDLGGSISAEHGIGRARLAELEHYKEPAELAMMRAVKRALDPKGIMNPGKVVRA